MKLFVTRTLVGAALLSVVLASIFGPRIGLLFGVMIVSCLGILEFAAMVKRIGRAADVWGILAANCALQITVFYQQMDWAFFLLIIFLIGESVRTMLGRNHYEDLFVSLYTLLYIGGLFSFLLLFPVDHQTHLLLVYLAAWATDTFAYSTGMLIGKHRLCPAISPKKSTEGAVGGVIGALLFTIPFWYFFFRELYLPVALFAVFIGSLAAQFGDLWASYLKRRAGIKDYGTLFAGHGGILDRFDSVLFAAPVVWVLLRLL